MNIEGSKRSRTAAMVPKKHKYRNVISRIKEDIVNGSIAGKLPGERVLAEELGVSYMTVRKAIAEMVDEGILEKQGTRGTFVNGKKHNFKPTGNIGFLWMSRSMKASHQPLLLFGVQIPRGGGGPIWLQSTVLHRFRMT
jgi:DNA-binding GntR family transcriptional regulator